MVKPYIPNLGDIVWIHFTPQVGHEQASRRPEVALPPKSYNAKSGLIVCVPVTNQIKGLPLRGDFKRSWRNRRGSGRSSQKPRLASPSSRVKRTGNNGRVEPYLGDD